LFISTRNQVCTNFNWRNKPLKSQSAVFSSNKLVLGGIFTGTFDYNQGSNSPCHISTANVQPNDKKTSVRYNGTKQDYDGLDVFPLQEVPPALKESEKSIFVWRTSSFIFGYFYDFNTPPAIINIRGHLMNWINTKS